MKKFRAALVLSSLFFLILCTQARTAESDSLTCSMNKGDSTRNGIMLYRVAPEVEYGFAKPRLTSFVTNFSQDMSLYFKDTFRKSNLRQLELIAASTAVLFVFDQSIVDEAKRLAKRWHIPSDDKTKSLFYVGKYPLRIPNSTGSALYYLGDGTTHILLAGTFLAYGLIANSNRPIQTASQLAEGMITVGVWTQFLKHITGHECPCRASAPGGVWRPFPNQVDYMKNVPKYDAFPSGHLATAMMCVTVIADNYPEHKYIRPLGYSLMAVVGFQMLNNGVHWASDYPLAIAIGYTLGHISQSRGHSTVKSEMPENGGQKTSWLDSIRLSPFAAVGNGFGIALGCDL